MKKIGLSGGIGSGKSTVARLMVELSSGSTVVIIDADKIAREVVEPGSPALAELSKAFGEDVLAPDGSLNRQLLAARAFASKESTAILNSITHPRIAEETKRLFRQAADEGADFAVYDVPLLVENDIYKDMDANIIVDVDPETRITRLIEHRGLDETDARRRIASQIADEKRLAIADFVIDNNGALQDLVPQVEEVVGKLKELLRAQKL